MKYVKSLLALALAALLGATAFATKEDYTGYRTSVASGTPQAVMLSFYDGPTTRGFTWQTDTSVTSGSVWLRQGDYMTMADIVDSADKTAKATTQTHSGDCTTYKANVTDLAAGLWSYCVGNGDNVVLGQFTVKASPTGPITIVNLNDVQTKVADKLTYWQNTVVAITNRLGSGTAADFILSGGDFIDINKVESQSLYVSWGVVADVARAALGSTPWIMARGNHDQSYYGELVGENFGSTGCHGFDYGNVHVATLPLYDNSSAVSSAVAEWLSADLSAAASVRWRIVILHAGPYTTGDHAAKEAFITSLTPILATNKVDLVLQAHDHTYSKTKAYLWTGNGYTQSESDAATLDLMQVTTNILNDGVAHYLNPQGTYYISAGCAGHRVGEQDKYATRGYGSSSYEKHTYKTATDTVKLTSTYAAAVADGSKDVGKAMFGVLTVDDATLVYDWFVTEDNGTVTKFDTLRVCKTPPPGEPERSLPEGEPECVTDVTLGVGETVAFTNACRKNTRFWLLGSTRDSTVATAELSIPDEPSARYVGYAHRSIVGTNEVVVTITGVAKGEETISFGRQYKRKDPVRAVSYRIKVK